jgi:UTP--glucose-1-phosphate uridylyltransferase
MKAVIVAAGYGSRFLPASKTVPKEMFPVIDRPAIDFILQELRESGVGDILFITSRRKRALEDYVDREVELEQVFESEGAAAKQRTIAVPPGRFFFLRQQRMLGTGQAILLAEPFTGDDPFVVVFPDDLHIGDPPLTQQLIDTYERTGCSVLAVEHDPPHLERYGVVALADDGLHVTDIVEKPPPGTEPSRDASIGRYLYTAEIYPALRRRWERHRGGEFNYTEGVEELARQGRVVIQRMVGRRLDIGSPAGYLRSILEYAARDPELAAEIESFRAADPAGADSAAGTS